MNPKYLPRIMKEIKELNEDPSLRTVVQPDPKDEMDIYYFTTIPNDGPMSGMPIIGRMVIPVNYPTDPPVLNLYTHTGRYNVDVYASYRDSKVHSSLCFDILRSKKNGGIWIPEYTISCLFASLMQSIVCYNVPQDYGGTKAEPVSMEKMASLERSTYRTYEQYKHLVPEIPVYGKVYAIPVKCRVAQFPASMRTPVNNRQQKIVSSKPFKLQDSITCSFDISDLKNNPNVVFSVILSNRPNDPVGRQRDTILIRDGVTATAAKKTRRGATSWFYHGTPMNKGIHNLTVTVHKNQFTISYLEEETGQMVVFGDSVVSFLREKELQSYNDPFYLSVFMKKKSGRDVTIRTLGGSDGYIHPSNAGDQLVDMMKKIEITTKSKNVDPSEKIPVYIGLEFDDTSSGQLDVKLVENLKLKYPSYKKSNCNSKNHGHVTLAYYKSFKTVDDYTSFITSNYVKDDPILVNVTGYVMNDYCVTFLVEVPSEVVYTPTDKSLHVTALLNGKPPVYSNTLIENTMNPSSGSDPKDSGTVVMFDTPYVAKSNIKFYGKLRKNSFK
jgi:ubiquitin-protein ligase